MNSPRPNLRPDPSTDHLRHLGSQLQQFRRSDACNTEKEIARAVQARKPCTVLVRIKNTRKFVNVDISSIKWQQQQKKAQKETLWANFLQRLVRYCFVHIKSS